MDHKPVFVDTWGWMALGYRREPRHTEVKRIYQALRSHEVPLYTSDYVLDELITLLFRREVFEEALRFVEGIMEAASLGQVRIERVTLDRFSAAWALRQELVEKIQQY
jgi:predicted nucleic acid-binding protein